ncbi:hypothetical protein AB1Y20_015650 [Prymnesium parvum]|uniref:Uncharacterized protein n=1 Tax=Prymnesium parvum TaxID=97485 RepID=A0AB34JXF0_PRYPA
MQEKIQKLKETQAQLEKAQLQAEAKVAELQIQLKAAEEKQQILVEKAVSDERAKSNELAAQAFQKGMEQAMEQIQRMHTMFGK